MIRRPVTTEGAPSVGLRIKKCLGAKENIRLGRDGQSVGYWIGAGVGSGKLMEPTRSYGGRYMIRRFIFPKSESWSKSGSWSSKSGLIIYSWTWSLEELWSTCWATNRDWGTK